MSGSEKKDQKGREFSNCLLDRNSLKQEKVVVDRANELASDRRCAVQIWEAHFQLYMVGAATILVKVWQVFACLPFLELHCKTTLNASSLSLQPDSSTISILIIDPLMSMTPN